MSQQILQVDQAMLETTLDRMVRKSVEETLNAMLDAEADEITGAARYERSGERKAYRAGHYVFCFNVCSTGSAVFFRSVG